MQKDGEFVMEMYKSAIAEKQEEKKNIKQEEITKWAKVTSFFSDGCPKITFDGEEEESNKKYSYLYTYKPSINDKVLLIKTNATYIIIGNAAYDIAPDPGTTEQDIIDIITSQLLLNKVVKLNSNGVINVDTTVYYNFFRLLDAELLRTNRFAMNNQTPINTRSVPSLSTSANLGEVITKVNTIISNLRSFGFFTT